MVFFRTYAEDVTTDTLAVERGFLNVDNRTKIYYGGWICSVGSGAWRWVR